MLPSLLYLLMGVMFAIRIFLAIFLSCLLAYPCHCLFTRQYQELGPATSKIFIFCGSVHLLHFAHCDDHLFCFDTSWFHDVSHRFLPESRQDYFDSYYDVFHFCIL